ncbi:helix-turn-helix transcriptional regulator [Novosphingobium profundi]|uniref:helix-turn-helix domain-containing protein n=1 Tax=Novosphingobium profundi TaxID=1774954 RepID=UPI001BD949C1|nr:helix-turn-helix transcriptional regulator [Novosphingobium profundi]MBT0667011.1 helix-turn-helix transcriptional regulator [Novosphingobium profundi]
MKLAAWRREEEMTQAQLADELGCSQSYVSQMERSSDPMIPGPVIMVQIYVMSCGRVQPNDFYALPQLTFRREAA